MKQNIGSTDRVIRVLIGVIILFLGWWYQSWWGLIGLLPLATAAIGWCPLYTLLGISSRTKE